METRSNHVLVGAVVLILLAVLALFTVWLARVNTTSEKEYDIFFKQAVDGLNKGSQVAFSGVPAGQVKEIGLFKPDPSLVRVRIAVNADVPVLQGTTATIQGVGFTGVSQIQLDGAVKGAQPLTQVGPQGCPVVPSSAGGLPGTGFTLSFARKQKMTLARSWRMPLMSCRRWAEGLIQPAIFDRSRLA